MSGYELALEHAAQALYEHGVGLAHSTIEKTEFDCSSMIEIFRRLKRETETSQVLIAFSYIEDRVYALLRYQMVDLVSKAATDHLFGSNGPLGTFANRITMAYHLGWLSKVTRNNVNCLRKIRNTFAHRAFVASYGDPEVRKLFDPLLHQLRLLDETAVAAAKREHAPLRRFVELNDAERYLASIALLGGTLFQELLVHPEALRHHVSPHDLIKNGKAEPTVVGRAQRNMIRAILEIFNSP